MNRFMILFFFVFLMVVAFGPGEVRAEDGQAEMVKQDSLDVSAKEIKAEDVTEISIVEIILGKWAIGPNKRSSKGSITFDKNGTYVMHEQLVDGTGVGTKGEYRLDSSVTPAKIDICADKCGMPGSEWTTRFGIIRILSDDKLEIQTSPDSNHPSGFSDDTSDKYKMMLTRWTE